MPLFRVPQKPHGVAPSRRGLLIGGACCFAESLVLPARSVTGMPETAPPLVFEEIADRVWLHTSWKRFPQGWMPSNGLAVQGRRGVLLVDTAWTSNQTVKLLDRIAAATSARSVSLVVTHAHDDRIAGLNDVHRAGYPSLAHEETAKFARERGLQARFTQTWSGDLRPLDLIGRNVELFHPGAARTSDNIVAFIADAQVLFGGCMIRALDQTGLGNVADADSCHWPHAARAVLERYGERSKIVVPGHGKFGPSALLGHTISLASAGRKASCG
jgi:metallo-beta-lactamase class B